MIHTNLSGILFFMVGCFLWIQLVRKKVTTMEKKEAANYKFFAQTSVDKLFSTFKTSLSGINNNEAEVLRGEYGENVISHKKKTPFIVEVLKAYFTPFTTVLLALCDCSNR